MSPQLVQGLSISRQAGQQVHSRSAAVDSEAKTFRTVLGSLAPDQPEESIDSTNDFLPRSDTDDEEVSQVDGGDEPQQTLPCGFLLKPPTSKQDPDQELDSEIRFVAHRAIPLVQTQDWQPADIAPLLQPVTPEIDENAAAIAIEKACKVSPPSDTGADGNTPAYQIADRLSLLESSDTECGVRRTADDDAMIGLLHSSTDPEPLRSIASIFSNTEMDQAVASFPLELPSARQIVSLIEGPLRQFCTSSTSMLDMRTQREEIRFLRMMLTPVTLGEVEVTLRRRGTDMQIRIVVSKQAAADALQADIGLLKDQIVNLLPADGTQSISISTKSQEGTAATGTQLHHRTEGDSANAWQEGLPAGGGEKPPPRKENARSVVESELHDQDTPPQLGADGIVV